MKLRSCNKITWGLGLVLLTPLSVFFALPAFGARPEESGSKKDVTIEEFLQSLSSVDGVVTRRDPFVEVSPPFEIPALDDKSASANSAPLLERYPVTDYEVVAVLLGDKYPRALLRLPKDVGTQKVVIIKERDKLGNGMGVIAKITAEGIIVQQSQRSKHGFVDKREILLKVGGKTEDQRHTLLSPAHAKLEADEDEKKTSEN